MILEESAFDIKHDFSLLENPTAGVRLALSRRKRRLEALTGSILSF
jgi:hypothetical protein